MCKSRTGTVSLLITDSLIYPQSDNGQRASFPCCIVTLFTDCLAAVITGLACYLTSCLPVLLDNAARVVYSSLATSVLWFGSARLTSAHFGSTSALLGTALRKAVGGECLPSIVYWCKEWGYLTSLARRQSSRDPYFLLRHPRHNIKWLVAPSSLIDL
jgi:hypothetical protein